MTHPLFRKDLFVETAFAKRFQEMLRSAWRDRAFHVIVADPGAGKTVSISDLLKTAGKRTVLAVVAPKNNEDEQALGDQFFTALGLPRRVHWRTRKPRLIAAFLKGDKKRDDDNGDDPWSVDPRSTVWLAG